VATPAGRCAASSRRARPRTVLDGTQIQARPDALSAERRQAKIEAGDEARIRNDDPRIANNKTMLGTGKSLFAAAIDTDAGYGEDSENASPPALKIARIGRFIPFKLKQDSPQGSPNS